MTANDIAIQAQPKEGTYCAYHINPIHMFVVLTYLSILLKLTQLDGGNNTAGLTPITMEDDQ